MKRALIIGCGQDGSYLSEYLISLGYRVTGMIRKNPDSSQWLKSMLGKVEFMYGDVRDSVSIESAVLRTRPDEIYNFAAQAFNPLSWTHPDVTLYVNAGGLGNILQTVERVKPDARVFQASTAEMFGDFVGPANEATPFRPISPYSVSKLAAHNLIDVYRRRGLFAVSGILFNHESPRRPPELVTKKIAMAVAAWHLGINEILPLGNLESRRDWGFAGEYIKVMHKMLQQAIPEDYVIGSGEDHSVKEFMEACCQAMGMSTVPMESVVVDDRLIRREQEKCVVADASKAYKQLGWKPQVGFKDLAKIMVEDEVQSLVNARVVTA